MEAADVARTIIEALAPVEVVEASGDWYCFVGAEPADQRMPFATIVTSNAHDRASDLDRPGVFRLNIGVPREAYEARFGPPPSGPITAEPVDTGHDYTARDVLMPHPIYASLGWVCIVSPKEATLEALRPLLADAHRIALKRQRRRESREG